MPRFDWAGSVITVNAMTVADDTRVQVYYPAVGSKMTLSGTGAVLRPANVLGFSSIENELRGTRFCVTGYGSCESDWMVVFGTNNEIEVKLLLMPVTTPGFDGDLGVAENVTIMFFWRYANTGEVFSSGIYTGNK